MQTDYRLMMATRSADLGQHYEPHLSRPSPMHLSRASGGDCGDDTLRTWQPPTPSRQWWAARQLVGALDKPRRCQRMFRLRRRSNSSGRYRLGPPFR